MMTYMANLPEKDISERTQRHIIVYSALGILIISLIVSIVSIVPLYKSLKTSKQNNLVHTLHERTMLVDEYLSRLKDIALQISSRTMIREKLELYNRGVINLDELTLFSIPKLMDAISLSKEVAGICRHDQAGNPVIRYGLPIPLELCHIPAEKTRGVLIFTPTIIEKELHILVSAPILNKESMQVGTDNVLFKTSKLRQIVEDYTGLGETGEAILGVVKNNQLQTFFPLRKNKGNTAENISEDSLVRSAMEKALRKETGIMTSDKSSAFIAYEPIQFTDWGIVVRMDKGELYSSVNHHILGLALIVMGLILLGTYGTVLLIRPLIGTLQKESIARSRAESEKLYFLNVLEASLNEIYMFDAETLRFLYVNKGALNNLGYRLDAMKTMTPLDIKPEFDETTFRNLIAPLLKHEQEKLVFQAIHRRADSSIYPVEIHLQLIENLQERAFLAIILDITERKRHEDELQKSHDELELLVEKRTADLKESEEKYRRLVETSTDAIVSVNEKGKIILWNEAASNVFGYYKDEMIGNPVDVIIPEKYRSAHIEGFRRYLETGEGIFIGKTAEFEGQRKDLTLVPIELSISSLKTDGFIIITGIIRDITERKKLEAELEKSRRLEAIGTLAGGMAHDFNNLLTVILGNIAITKMHMNSDNKDFDKLTNAENACMKATELTKRLITFSKGGAPILNPVLISEIATEAICPMMKGSDITCECVIPEHLYPVYIDEGQIRQVFRNMAINAKEAMPDGGVIRIDAENITLDKGNIAKLKEGKYVKVSIKDSGKGIPEDVLPKIFDPYFTTKEMGAERGLGLGLAVCYSILKKHNGHIAVESKTGEGTTFHIYLPAAEIEIKGRESLKNRE